MRTIICIFILFLSTQLNAATISECTSKINLTQETLSGTNISGRNADRTRAGLNSKLSGALVKLDEAKFCDSVKKLLDFVTTVSDKSTPNRKGESAITPDDGSVLMDQANDAIACERALDSNCY